MLISQTGIAENIDISRQSIAKDSIIHRRYYHVQRNRRHWMDVHRRHQATAFVSEFIHAGCEQ